MAGFGKLGLIALITGLTAGAIGAGEASADPVHILTLGDSITAGVGSDDSQFRNNSGTWSNRGGSGYRRHLNDLIAQNGLLDEWNFVGTRSAPSTNPADQPAYSPTITNNWHRHFGVPGTTADSLRGQLGSFTESSPNTILLHIGSNSSANDMTSSPATYSLTSNTAADAQLYRLLDDLRTNDTYNTADQILVARIIPKADAADLPNIIDYNYSATQGIAGAINALPDPFESKIQVVDLFKIGISDSMLSFLAGQFGLANNLIADMIDPGSTGYVDWLAGLDEATHQVTGSIARNANLYTDIVGFDGSDYIYGTSDGTHPSDLGYAVMAWAWGQAIPEPTTFAFAALAGLGLVARRRR